MSCEGLQEGETDRDRERLLTGAESEVVTDSQSIPISGTRVQGCTGKRIRPGSMYC